MKWLRDPENGRNAAASPRCRRRSSAKSRARVGVPRTRREPLTSGPLKKRAPPVERVDRSVAAVAAGWTSRWTPHLRPLLPTGTSTPMGSTGSSSQQSGGACDRRRRVRMLKRVAMAVFVTLTGVAAASGQTSPAGQKPATQQPATTGQQSSSSTMSTDVQETRPATTTYMGDTGLWFVPTGDILPAKKWSFSAYRVNFDYNEGFSDISDWPVTFGVGVADRAEIFGAWSLVRRIDRDVRPIFTGTQGGGTANEYPFVRQGWSDNQLGDLWLGAKINLTSQWRQQPAAFALRGMIKVPTAKEDEEGVGTGKMDWALDAIVSKEFNQRVELSGFGGFIVRGDPDDVDVSNGFRWGFGAGFPTRKNLRLTAELHGEAYTDDTLIFGRTLVGEDGSVAPATTQLSSPVNASLGLTWLGRNWFAGGGLNYRFKGDGRSEFGNYEDETGDFI